MIRFPAMKRLALMMLLVGCGGDWPDGEWSAGGPGWVAPPPGSARVTFSGGRYERESGGCLELGTYAVLRSVGLDGEPATDVALTAEKGSCGSAWFLRRDDSQLWLRPVPPETLHTAYWRR